MKIGNILCVVMGLTALSACSSDSDNDTVLAQDDSPTDNDTALAQDDPATDSAEIVAPEPMEDSPELSNVNDIINPTNYISLLTATSDLLGNALSDSPLRELDITAFAGVPDSNDNLTDFSCLISGSLNRTIAVDLTTTAQTTTTSYGASDCTGPAGSWDGTYTVLEYIETEATSGYSSTEQDFDIELSFSDGSGVSATGTFGSFMDGVEIYHSFNTSRYVASNASGITSIIGRGSRDDLYFEPVESRLGFTAEISGDTVYADDPTVVLTVSASPSDELFGIDFDSNGSFAAGELMVTASDGSEVIARTTPDADIAHIKITASDTTIIEENRPWTSFFTVQ